MRTYGESGGVLVLLFLLTADQFLNDRVLHFCLLQLLVDELCCESEVFLIWVENVGFMTFKGEGHALLPFLELVAVDFNALLPQKHLELLEKFASYHSLIGRVRMVRNLSHE